MAPAHQRLLTAAFLVCVLGLIAACSSPSQETPDATPEATAASQPLSGTPVTETTAEPPMTQTPEPAPTPDEHAHLLLPDLMTTVPDDIYIQQDVGGARLLRFSTTVKNAGEGPLELIGEMAEGGEQVNVTQLIQQRDEEEAVEREAGRLVRSVEHAHWHLESFALFELWPVARGEASEQAPLTQNKITFCLLDEVRIEPELDTGVDNPQFFHCGWETQGISAGWQETYLATLPGQYLDITSIPDGEYYFRMTLDPENRLLEIDPDNNEVTILLRIEGFQVEVVEQV